jgi:hypothetical protein
VRGSQRVLLFCALFLFLISPSFAKENMPDPTFDSGHVIVPVKTVDGDIHNVAVPQDTSLQDFHAALNADPNYLHEFTRPSQQPLVRWRIPRISAISLRPRGMQRVQATVRTQRAVSAFILTGAQVLCTLKHIRKAQDWLLSGKIKFPTAHRILE